MNLSRRNPSYYTNKD
uniref:Uncharacterized protein n=1 Tax=Anguilla anguilla TaxID=7936 RepID=A0A0E9QYN3_ANGAN